MKNSRGTELEIDVNPNINVVFGSVDKNNPKTIYIKFSAWANPIDYRDKNDYKTIIRKIVKRIKTYLYANIDSEILKRDMTMVDMDMRDSGIASGKSSFMSCEVTLYQKNNFYITSDILNNEMQKLSYHISNNIFNDDEHFEFYQHKKEAKQEL